jgi:para-aminobenzoate synthetase component 1
MLYSAPLLYLTDPAPYFAVIRGLPWAAWLDSGRLGRYDIIVANPVATLVTQGRQTEICCGGTSRISEDDPFDLLREMQGARIEPQSEAPFAGGALGYWSYDLARRYLVLPEYASDREHLPQMAVGIYDWALVVDHHKREARLLSHLKYPGTEVGLAEVLRRLESAPLQVEAVGSFRVEGSAESNLNAAAYAQAFARVQAYLHEGDCYQVNLARRYEAKASGDAWVAYLALRRLSPAPYSAFLDWPSVQVLCASPERFLEVRRGRVETRPIKGTRPRASDAEADARLAADLCSNPKDRAENLMIVDLLRNDLGKSCLPGSVRTPRLFELESYANVHHLVSTVEGWLRPECDALDVLRDCFPGGSVTGAPKKRAMEIIEQLEPDRRGIYCGSVGYVGFDGQMDSNIAIRTMVHAQGHIRCWAGGGLVADSRCTAEFQETLDKASAMLAVLERFRS